MTSDHADSAVAPKNTSVTALLAARPVLSWRHHIWLVGAAVLLYGLDVLTKQLALRYLVPLEPHYLLGPWLRIELLFNSGAAFSLGESFTIVFALLGMVALLVLVILIAPRVRTPLENLVTGLLIAGVAGNLTDRIVRPDRITGSTAPLHGSVVDWIAVQYFAVFNVADMCITAAAVIVIIWLLKTSVRHR